MKQAISIHVGLDTLDPGRYNWSRPLSGAENDAREMRVLADAAGFRPQRVLLGAEATVGNLRAALAEVAATLVAGDFLLLSFSGHGAALSDRDGDDPDDQDEAWLLYDDLLLDDEIHDHLCQLAAGVRVVVVSDSCFSGSVTRHEPPGRSGVVSVRSPRRAVARDGAMAVATRTAPKAVVQRLLRERGDTYVARRQEVMRSRRRDTEADVILLAACEDGMMAGDGDPHGRFTAALLAVWDGGRFAGDYHGFLEAIQARFGTDQTPQLFIEGVRDPEFLKKRPFTP